MNAALCVPLLAEDQILGLLCIKDERLREAYATDEVDLFRGVAAQLVITVQNSKLYERMKERDRLAALGEMAAGLAHEIRNPLGAIKGAAQLLLPPADGGDPAASVSSNNMAPEAREFLGIIVEEANRLNKVVSQFLDYARPYRGEPQPLDVNEVVRKTAQLVENHGGTIEVRSRVGVGSTFSVFLPALEPNTEETSALPPKEPKEPKEPKNTASATG
jgi:signal transduction histidine kinase